MHADSPKAYETILYATDLQPDSMPALRRTAKLADAMGAKLHVVYAAAPPVPQPVMQMPVVPRVESDSPGTRLGQHLERALGDRRHDVEGHVESGSPERVIENVAGEIGADVVVLASHRRSGISALLRGSTAKSLLKRSSLPVLLVPRDGSAAPI